MQVTLVTDEGTTALELPAGTTIAQVIAERRLNAETFFIKRNGRLCHPQTVLQDGDELRLVGIIYGG